MSDAKKTKSKKLKMLLFIILLLPVMLLNYACFGGSENGTGNNGGGTSTTTSYTVIFYTDSSISFNIPSQEIEAGRLVRKPTDPIKEGYDFLGWYSNIELTNIWWFEINTVQSNMTLYAKWEKQQ